MDQDALVDGMIEAGAEFAARVNDIAPLKAAFWIKPQGSGRWVLNLVSRDFRRQLKNKKFTDAAHLVHEFRNPYLSIFNTRLLSDKDPLAQQVFKVQKRHSGKNPIIFDWDYLGEIVVDGGYIYPLAALNAHALPNE